MKLYSSYGLTALPGAVVEILVSCETQQFLLENEGRDYHKESKGELMGLKFENGRGPNQCDTGYQFCLAQKELAKKFSLMADLLAVLNEVPIPDRSSYHPLIELSLGANEGQFTVAAQMHKELFDWCLENLQGGSDLSQKLLSQTTEAWQLINPSAVGGPPRQADSFECGAVNGQIQLGRSGGNFGAYIEPPTREPFARLDPFNTNDYPAIVPLLVYQLALIENAFQMDEG